jgi:DHA1 family bicyclomycin/chloramphenicol resistance-like MFS transporter
LARDNAFLATLASITLIGPLAIHVFMPVLPVVRTVFGVTEAIAGLTFSVSVLIIAASTLAYGSLSDRYGRRPLLLGGLVLFIAGGAISALAPSMAWLAAGRVIQALGAGCSGGLTRAIARDAYGSDGLVKIIAYLTMAYTLGPMLAPLVAGALLDLSGWRAVFWFSTGAGALILAASYFILGETHRPAPAAGPRRGFLRDYVELFSHARFAAFVLQSAFSTSTFYVMATAASFMMMDYLGRSSSEYGLYFMLFPAGFFLGNLVSSRVSQRVGLENMVVWGSVVNLAAAAAQSTLLLAGQVSPLALFLPGFFVTFGQGIAMPNAQAGAIRIVPRLTGTAAGVAVFCQMALGALAAQAYAWLADGTPVPVALTVAACSALTVAFGVLAWWLKPSRPG